MTKHVYTQKNNAQRAANKLDVAQVVAVEGGWIVQTPEDIMNNDEVAAKNLNEDFDDGQVTGAPAYEDTVTEPLPGSLDEQAALDAEPSQVAAEGEKAEEAEEPAQDDEILMQLRVYLRADTACATARKIATLVGNPVNIHMVGGNLVQTIQPGERAERAAKPKAERAAKASDGQPSGKTAQIIELARREEGVTRAQLTETIGWGKQAPWTSVLKNAAERFGYDLVINKDGRIATYFLVREQAAEAA